MPNRAFNLHLVKLLNWYVYCYMLFISCSCSYWLTGWFNIWLGLLRLGWHFNWFTAAARSNHFTFFYCVFPVVVLSSARINEWTNVRLSEWMSEANKQMRLRMSMGASASATTSIIHIHNIHVRKPSWEAARQQSLVRIFPQVLSGILYDCCCCCYCLFIVVVAAVFVEVNAGIVTCSLTWHLATEHTNPKAALLTSLSQWAKYISGRFYIYIFFTTSTEANQLARPRRTRQKAKLQLQQLLFTLTENLIKIILSAD